MDEGGYSAIAVALPYLVPQPWLNLRLVNKRFLEICSSEVFFRSFLEARGFVRADERVPWRNTFFSVFYLWVPLLPQFEQQWEAFLLSDDKKSILRSANMRLNAGHALSVRHEAAAAGPRLVAKIQGGMSKSKSYRVSLGLRDFELQDSCQNRELVLSGVLCAHQMAVLELVRRIWLGFENVLIDGEEKPLFGEGEDELQLPFFDIGQMYKDLETERLLLRRSLPRQKGIVGRPSKLRWQNVAPKVDYLRHVVGMKCWQVRSCVIPVTPRTLPSFMLQNKPIQKKVLKEKVSRPAKSATASRPIESEVLESARFTRSRGVVDAKIVEEFAQLQEAEKKPKKKKTL